MRERTVTARPEPGRLAAAPPAVAGGRARSGDVLRGLAVAFDADFSDVRVQTGSTAARDIGARAFTRGPELHFAPGEYRPDAPDGVELLARA